MRRFPCCRIQRRRCLCFLLLNDEVAKTVVVMFGNHCIEPRVGCNAIEQVDSLGPTLGKRATAVQASTTCSIGDAANNIDHCSGLSPSAKAFVCFTFLVSDGIVTNLGL